jgi:hypothetical protein
VASLFFFVPVLLISFTWPLYSQARVNTHWPLFPAAVVAGMDATDKKIPQDAVVWAWWDVGYTFSYWAKRGIISDGTYHGGQLAVYNALPLATHDYRLAANFMQFYVTRGLSGIDNFYSTFQDGNQKGFRFIKKVLAAGPEKAKGIIANAPFISEKNKRSVEEWVHFFFPSGSPLYLFLDARLIQSNYWWYWLGTWDVEQKQGDHRLYQYLTGVQINEELNKAVSEEGIVVDLESGMTRLRGRDIPIKKAIFRGNGQDYEVREYHDVGANFELLLPKGYGVLADSKIAESVYNKLFVRHILPKEPYFRPVIIGTPAFQLWVVQGDQLTEKVKQEDVPDVS